LLYFCKIGVIRVVLKKGKTSSKQGIENWITFNIKCPVRSIVR
jgi:hypothetical protein